MYYILCYACVLLFYDLVTISCRFHRITWGGWGFNQDYPAGVIVGGCDNGLLQIYSASRLLAGEESLVVTQNRHHGPVRAIDFNSYQVQN